MDQNQTKPALNPAALSIADAALLLSKVSSQSVTATMIEKDLRAGAPTNPDGTINLVYYAAWLVKEADHGG